MMDMTRGARGEVVIRLDGNFDASAANRLVGWLGGVPSTQPLVIDFSHVRECEDFGLAAVAPGLAERADLVVHGLTRHHERMLRYFGVKLDPSAGPGADDDAPS